MSIPVILDFHPTATGIRPLSPVECGAFNRFALVDGEGNTIDVVGWGEMTEILRADMVAGIAADAYNDMPELPMAGRS